MKTKTYILTFFMLLSGVVFGQRLASCGVEVKFKINDTIETIDFLIEKNFLTEREPTEREPIIRYDSINKEFITTLLHFTYGEVPRSFKCPDIYLRVNPKNGGNQKELIIPIYFENVEEKNQRYDLGLIDINEFIETPLYEIIEVKADKSIHKRRKGEYELRRMDNLIELKLENEN